MAPACSNLQIPYHTKGSDEEEVDDGFETIDRNGEPFGDWSENLNDYTEEYEDMCDESFVMNEAETEEAKKTE